MPRSGATDVWATSDRERRVPIIDLSGQQLALLGALIFVIIAVPVATMEMNASSFEFIIFGTVGGYLLGFVGMAVSAIFTRESDTV
ncbi:MAG: hypothetical protein R3324_08145 [Halobacteriales archaeon]|nr:hypothetical protein [Halobacteriales archaeon]